MKNHQILINTLLLHGLIVNCIVVPVLLAISFEQSHSYFVYAEWIYSIGLNIFLWQVLGIHIRVTQDTLTYTSLFLEMKKNIIVQYLHSTVVKLHTNLRPSIYNSIVSLLVLCSFIFIIFQSMISKNSLLFILIEWIVFLQCWRIFFVYQDYFFIQKEQGIPDKIKTFWLSDLFFMEKNLARSSNEKIG